MNSVMTALDRRISALPGRMVGFCPDRHNLIHDSGRKMNLLAVLKALIPGEKPSGTVFAN